MSAQSSRPGAALFREAVRPRSIVLLVVFLAIAAVCARLGVWQLDRAYERARLSAEHEAAEQADATPRPLGEVLQPQQTFGGDNVGRRVTVTGNYEAPFQVFVPGRSAGEEQGYLVVDGLRVTDDGSNGQNWADLSAPPVLAVVRGWVPYSALDDSGAVVEQWRDTLAPPDAPVELIGWLQASEAMLSVDLPAGQVSSISTGALANTWQAPSYGGYLVVSQSNPTQPQDITLLPRPTIEGGDGVNMKNFFYALQWWVFGLFAVALWLRLVRDSARDVLVGEAPDQPANPFDLVDHGRSERS